MQQEIIGILSMRNRILQILGVRTLCLLSEKYEGF